MQKYFSSGKKYIPALVLSVPAAGILLVLGDFPLQFFAFPVNAAALLMWLAVIWVLFREKRESGFVRLMLARKTTLALLAVFVAACLVQGFSKSGVTGSWWFVAVEFLLLTHLFFVLLRGMDHPRRFRTRFFLNHAGLLLALGSGMFGAPDTHDWRMVVGMDAAVSEAVDADGHRTSLEYEFRLLDWEVEEYGNGAPKSYEAIVQVGDGRVANLRVNHPFRLSWRDDLYLSGFNEHGCVLQVVRHPWKYLELLGIVMMLAGAVLVFLQGPAGKAASDGRAGA